jgi:hypothetical protein
MKKQRVELHIMAIKTLIQPQLHLHHNIMTQIITTNNKLLIRIKEILTTHKQLIHKTQMLINNTNNMIIQVIQSTHNSKIMLNIKTFNITNKAIINNVTTNKEDMLKNTMNNKTTGMVEIDIIKIIGIITTKTITITIIIKIIIQINM